MTDAKPKRQPRPVTVLERTAYPDGRVIVRRVVLPAALDIPEQPRGEHSFMAVEKRREDD